MILHPGILALLLGALTSLALLTSGALIGLRILRHWHPELANEQQLGLERQSWLVATLVQWAVGFEALSIFLFIYTADDLHPLFAGAMCATGTLNANPVGWHLIWIKLLLFVLGGLWWVAHHVDQQIPAAPLTRTKFLALWLLMPLSLADLLVMSRYFTGLKPEIVTSCCGSLFSTGGQGLATDLSSLPLWPMILTFFVTATLYTAGMAAGLRFHARWLKSFLAFLAIAFCSVGLASSVSFISIYYYQLPTHHCPFDLLQSRYHFIGYPLYLLLFGTLLCGLIPQLLELLPASPENLPLLAATERHWLTAGLVMMAVLLALVSWPLLFSDFTMRGYP